VAPFSQASVGPKLATPVSARRCPCSNGRLRMGRVAGVKRAALANANIAKLP
jgi:hypothetical protein